MRVIAGAHKGRRLVVPAGSATRPTSDRVREALFSILGSRVQGAQVLDLFAGSGALGIEALSRGAAAATFVDDAAPAVGAIRRNLEAVEGGTVVQRDARGFLRDAQTDGRQYDLIFVDPPYRQAATLGRELAEALAAVVRPGGLVISESDRRAPLDFPDLPFRDERRYGDTLIRLHAI